MIELRAHLPSNWLAALGDYRSSGGYRSFSSEPDQGRIEEAATALGRPVRFKDDEGYEREIVAAVAHPLGEAVAYVECQSQWRGDFQDINYYLRVLDRAGRESASEIATYNPFFGCGVQFLDWFGNVALGIYREKHQIIVCRFGLGVSTTFKPIERSSWILDGYHLGYRHYEETSIRRLVLPSLEPLTSLTEAEAAEWGLLPPE
jgi:hypothetical protein